MKLHIELDPELEGCEVTIRCPEMTEDVMAIKKAVSEAATGYRNLVFYKNDKEHFFSISQIIFFETDDCGISAHTVSDVFLVKYKLYELEKLLPGYFMRVSKSTILNTREVYCITKNITSSSAVEFRGTHKKVYVSRNYYKALKNKLGAR